jgi:hypothetical protein
MKALIISVVLLYISISAMAQSNTYPDGHNENADSTLIQSEPADAPNATPIVTEKSTTPVPAEIQLAEPKSKSSTGIKEDE